MDVYTLIVVADDPLSRAGLTAVLADMEQVEVLAGVESHADLVAVSARYPPRLLVWDLGWDPEEETEGQGTPLARLATAVELDVPVLALIPDGSYALDVWRHGVRAVLPRSVGAGQLAAALPPVDAGLAVIAPAFVPDIVGRRPAMPDGPVDSLTPREEEVLALLAEGMTNRAIGQALSISEHTAKFHVQAVMGKLGAQSRTEAVVLGMRLGLVRL